jgi:hypothetical protein
MSAEDYSHHACPNPDSPAYSQRGQATLRPHGWSTADQRVRCLQCTTCGQHFSERANTPLFGLCSPADTLVTIARHLAEGAGRGSVVGSHWPLVSVCFNNDG